MIVHLYAQCWNDESMLPFFFRHYDRLVDRYLIYDDGSEDATWSLLKSHPRVEARHFVRNVADSFAISEQALSNECWKESRGEADWVIVTDVDEHLVHPAGRDYFATCSNDGVTLIPALGFQMISGAEPDADAELARDYARGAPWTQMMKASVFNPDAIDAINFAPGRHRADPQGRVLVPRRDEMLLLHYKYLGFERTLERHRMLRRGLGKHDLARGLGHKYSWSEDELRADWERVEREAVDVAASVQDPQWRYPFEPWWERYRRL